MTFRQLLKGNEGYTLLETLVAMALFVGVLIPVGATVANFMFDKSSERLSVAFQACESEIARVMESRSFQDTVRTMPDGLILQRKVERVGQVFEMNIMVASKSSPAKPIVVVHKTIFAYQ